MTTAPTPPRRSDPTTAPPGRNSGSPSREPAHGTAPRSPDPTGPDSPDPTGGIRVSGGATSEEIAAVLAVLAAVTSQPGAPGDVADDAPFSVGAARVAGRWGRPGGAVRHPLDHAPGAWQRAVRP
ncbi:MAG: acyl-CoA carboxylase epsilon subunit [Dermatophilaceae bacterium]